MLLTNEEFICENIYFCHITPASWSGPTQNLQRFKVLKTKYFKISC